MTEALKLEVGKKYFIEDNRFILTFVADLSLFGFKDSPKYLFINSAGQPRYYTEFEFFQQFKEYKEELMKEEVKLEVGKKYKFLNELSIYDGIWEYIITFMRSENEREERKVHYFKQYINGNKVLAALEIADEEISTMKIKEHRELIKHSVDAWFNYSESPLRNGNNSLDRITNLLTTGILYSSKQEAKSYCTEDWKQRYGRFTFEELPAPKED